MGSAGGGGGTVTEQHAKYIKDWHKTALDGLYVGITAAENPYNYDAYNPSSFVDAILGALAAYTQVTIDFNNDAIDVGALATANGALSTMISAVDVDANWATYFAAALAAIPSADIVDDTDIATAVGALTDVMEDEIESKVLPQFEAGMRDINAVISSAFVLGEAIIYDGLTKAVAKEAGGFRMRAMELNAAAATERIKIASLSASQISEMAIRLISEKKAQTALMAEVFTRGIEAKKALAAMAIDGFKIAVIMKKEQTDTDNMLDSARRKWDVEKWASFGNLLGAVQGSITKTSDYNSQGSALGGIGSIFSSLGAMASIAAVFMK